MDERTMTDEASVWRVKLAAWTHDPAEKPFVLFRDPAGHEGGTVRGLRERIFGHGSLPRGDEEIVRRADRWAAAADRPQFPRKDEKGRPYQPWAQVDFVKNPVLKHPLSGTEYDLKCLTDVNFEAIREASLGHLSGLIRADNGEVDYRKTFLRFWRLGPVKGPDTLGALWAHLPADTRVPDHSIWEHLRLTSALAGAMKLDPEGRVALLLVSLGPVQSFIETARSTSDLWAGSHLLSRLAWEALRVVCERLGPDAVIYPDLNATPPADLWLLEQDVLTREELKDEEPELFKGTDANPLFSAALPNRFVAIVPERLAKQTAETIEFTVRDRVLAMAKEVLQELLRVAKVRSDEKLDFPEKQIDRQFRDFPEVVWATVPWRLAGDGDKVEPAPLAKLLRTLEGESRGHADRAVGLLGTKAWEILSGEIGVDGTRFYAPNPGVVYGDLYTAVTRVHAAAKSERRFDPVKEQGYRCTLCGEREWLTTDPQALEKPRGRRGETLWKRVAKEKPSWARKNDHLCGPCALKRLWPSVFVRHVEETIHRKQGERDRIQRFVVSTHAMAIARTLEWIIHEAATKDENNRKREAITELAEEVKSAQRVALPQRIIRTMSERKVALADLYDPVERIVQCLPDRFDELAEADKYEKSAHLEGLVQKITGERPERYYALVLMDGDRMGRWLSGHPDFAGIFRDCWHPQIRSSVEEHSSPKEALQGYLDAPRPPSPAWHVAISRALNGFCLHMAREVVERLFKGRILYSGGDDLMAMVSVDDLLSVLLVLRCAYSGELPRLDPSAIWELLRSERPGVEPARTPRLGGGHGLVQGRLLRLMGQKATASAGAVVAHYATPLGSVLRELRAAERRAKGEGGRDAFSITLMKRAGGRSHLTSKWFDWGNDHTGQSIRETPISVLLRLREALASPALSRRAAYNILGWLDGFADDSPGEMLISALAYQFRRQAKEGGGGASSGDERATGKNHRYQELAEALARFAGAEGTEGRIARLRNAIVVAEFLAREGRA